MTTLYEHRVLGTKIMVVGASFNMPFLVGNGNICLYEDGIILLDDTGEEKYIIGLNDFECRYESFINTKKLRYTKCANLFNEDIGCKCRGKKGIFKRVNGNVCGKFIIDIPEIDNIELLDNHLLKYKKLYDAIKDLKNGVNPLKKYNNKQGFFSKLFKYKMF